MFVNAHDEGVACFAGGRTAGVEPGVVPSCRRRLHSDFINEVVRVYAGDGVLRQELLHGAFVQYVKHWLGLENGLAC